MEHTIKIGTEGFETKIVEQTDTAKALGSGIAEVFATPALIALMENTAYKSIEMLLPEGFTTVGIEINTKHIQASLPGAIISCKSTVTKIDDKKISFEITASDNNGTIGSANHTRFIVNSEKFMSRLLQAK